MMKNDQSNTKKNSLSNFNDKNNSLLKEEKTVIYKFNFQKKLNFGQGLYIIGNIKQLGKWDLDSAVRLQCYQNHFWIKEIQIPVNVQVQYKFIIASYEHHPQKHLENTDIKQWIGDKNGKNLILFIDTNLANYQQYKLKTKELKIMSFNVRFDSKSDKNECSWQNRKQNCVNVIKQFRPSIFGVQQPLKYQKQYLYGQLGQQYDYYGVARDCFEGEEVGLFLDKERFITVEYGFQWISESKKPGNKGYGARLPRYFTYIIVQDLYTSSSAQQFFATNKSQKQLQYKQVKRSLIMIVNVHLDHESELSQRKGIQQIVQKLEVKSKQYANNQNGILEDFFLIGDFNNDESNPIFKNLKLSVLKMNSIREILKGNKNCDNRATFHGFSGNFIMKIVDAITTNSYLTIDHLFMSTINFKPISFQVLDKFTVKNQKKPILSDHHPILGTFQSNK